MKIRQYQPNDYADILEISKHIWDGNDYLPKLINEFYESPHCDPYVVEEDDKVISIVNVNKFTNKFYWLESMRTHPDYRNRGIATELNKFLLQEATKSGVEEVWLSTSQANEATAKMLLKAGFEEMALLKLWDNTDELEEQEIAKNNGIIDGKLMNIDYIPQNVSEEVNKLESSWRPATSKDEIKKILEKRASEGQKFVFLVGEFNIFPLDSYFVDSWIQNQYIFINHKTDSIMTFKPAKEHLNSYVLGIYDFNKDVITSALLFGFNQVKSQKQNDESHSSAIDIRLFYPFAIYLKLLDSAWVFRIMKKKT